MDTKSLKEAFELSNRHQTSTLVYPAHNTSIVSHYVGFFRHQYQGSGQVKSIKYLDFYFIFFSQHMTYSY